VSRFTDQAQDLLDAALGADTPPDLTIIVTEDGSLRMFSASDWPLDSLAREHGAKSAYRVTATSSQVRVEAREGLRRCILESRKPFALPW
jgi:hypothetical protein